MRAAARSGTQSQPRIGAFTRRRHARCIRQSEPRPLGGRCISGGATNGRTIFGGATATTLGSGIALGVATSGSGAQISVSGRTSSRAPATIVCGAFTRARGGRASRCVSAGAISGSFSCRLYQTIFFSFGRIS